MAIRKQHQEILQWVESFLRLNDLQRSRPLSEKEIKSWFELKHKIEKALFSQVPPGEPANDKRRSLRVRNLHLPILFDNKLEQSEGWISEVSDGGLFILTPDPLPVGTRLDLFLKFPMTMVKSKNLQEKEMEFSAEVVFTHGGFGLGEKSFSGMGMKIEQNLSPSNQRQWFSFVDFLLQEAVE